MLLLLLLLLASDGCLQGCNNHCDAWHVLPHL
jgi:hypothetical protein